MRKVYYIERRVYSLDKGEPAGSDYVSIMGHKAYANFDLAHQDLMAIKGLRNRRSDYVQEYGAAREISGEVRWPKLNLVEEYRICRMKVLDSEGE